MNELDCSNIPAPSTKIFRWMSKKNFFKFIKGSNALVNFHVWDDLFEHTYAHMKVRMPGNELPNIASLGALSKQWFGQCWTTNDPNETDAFWRIYGKDSVCVQTTVQKMLDTIQTQSLSKPKAHLVVYDSKEKITEYFSTINFEQDIVLPGSGDKCPLFLYLKTKSFEYEQEIRFIAYIEKNEIDRFSYSFEPKEVVEKVILSPYLSQDKFTFFKTDIEEFLKNDFAENNQIITQSSLILDLRNNRIISFNEVNEE